MRRRSLLGSLVSMGVAGLAAAGPPAVDLAVRARQLLSLLPSPELRDFLEQWPASRERRPSVAATVPVLRYLPAARREAPLFCDNFVAALAAAAPLLAWHRSYTEAEVGAQFLDNYGWTELVGLTGPLASVRLACGVLLLGPQVTYPSHHHEADEIYVPLSGTARWKVGDGDWELQPPGSVIHHLPNESHAMRTGEGPLLALYLWRSRDLHQKAHLDVAVGRP